MEHFRRTTIVVVGDFVIRDEHGKTMAAGAGKLEQIADALHS